MHALVGLGILAALVGFAFGERAARLFVGVLLSIGALAVLGVIALAVIEISRQEATTSYARNYR